MYHSDYEYNSDSSIEESFQCSCDCRHVMRTLVRLDYCHAHLEHKSIRDLIHMWELQNYLNPNSSDFISYIEINVSVKAVLDEGFILSKCTCCNVHQYNRPSFYDISYNLILQGYENDVKQYIYTYMDSPDLVWNECN